MPFKSSKQRKYLFAKKPAVAAKFAKDTKKKKKKSAPRFWSAKKTKEL